MNKLNLIYRELTPDFSYEDKWNEICLNTGGTQSTLQDIKVPEKAGGFCYKNRGSNNCTRNRFIYWRTFHDILELSEISLDYNLCENNVRYKFTDSPVLSVTIAEGENLITLLVTTVSSLHQINFPHPNSSDKISNESRMFSVFHEANSCLTTERSAYYVIGQAAFSSNPFPHTASNFLSTNGVEALFALAYQNCLVLFIMNCKLNQTISHLLKESNTVPRLLSNLREAFSGKSSSADSDQVSSMIFISINNEEFLVVLYHDGILRIWSTASLQVVASINTLRNEESMKSQGHQVNSLRKIDDLNFCAFVSNSIASEFVIIKVLQSGGSNYSMITTKVIPAPQSDLVDFVISEWKIWALWFNTQGEYRVSHFSLLPSSSMNWISVAMETLPDQISIALQQGMDPRQAFCSYIFRPGKFDKRVIAKALMMFRRSNVIYDGSVPLHVLQEQVCQAVESEIHKELKDFSDDGYLDLSLRFWEKFHSCCEQYHLKYCQPMGLMLLNSINALCIVKKNMFSLLRPCEIVEHLMLAGQNADIKNYLLSDFHENIKFNEDILHLIELLSKVEFILPDDMKQCIDKKLYLLEMPDIIISKLMKEILSSDENNEISVGNFSTIIWQSLQQIGDLCAAIAALLELLRLNSGNLEFLCVEHDITEKRQVDLMGNIFYSDIGVSILSQTARQIVEIRYFLCRNLLILQQLIIDTFSVSCDVQETIRSQFMPETVVFVQAYYVMIWICETPTILNHVPFLDSNTRKLNSLQIKGNYAIKNNQQSSSLITSFITSEGLCAALKWFIQGTEKVDYHSKSSFSLVTIASFICNLIWPLGKNFVFEEWLFQTHQYLIIQEYTRLLNGWCEPNNCSRQFMLAVSFLENGEHHKAYDLFLQSTKGLFVEPFLKGKIVKHQKLTTTGVLVQYYLKVIQLFEQHNALEYIIFVAQTASGISDKDDVHLPMFQSIVFNNHLLLEHYEEAYHSLIYNADSSRREDCLRQLIVSLFKNRRLDLLMHFPYIGLRDEFENIVENRARSMKIEHNTYYNFLYAFHISAGNMRKASSVMYEQALRFRLENVTLEGMQKRYSCLLACLNCINLIDEKYQWIAKPVFDDSNDIILEKNVKEKVIVIEKNDLKKEILETEAIMCLAKYQRDVGSFLNVGAQQLSNVSANYGLFTLALKLARSHNLNFRPIFDSLTAACVRVTSEHSNESLPWLQENDIADLPQKNKVADIAWLFLQKMIIENEKVDSTDIRKIVANKILSLSAFIPQWLYSSYKADNSSELLRLLINHGRLLEAADLIKEFIWATLGLGCEYFKVKNPVTSTMSPICCPFNTIDRLLYGLKINSDVVEHKQALLELEELVQNYIATVNRVTDDAIQYRYQLCNTFK